MTIDNELFLHLLKEAKGSPRLRTAMDLRNSAEDQSQRMLNALQPGTQVPVHRHPLSSETIVVLYGHLTEIYFNEEGHITEEFQLGVDGLIGLNIPKGQWHTVRVTEPCVIMEVKDGPYRPAQPEDLR